MSCLYAGGAGEEEEEEENRGFLQTNRATAVIVDPQSSVSGPQDVSAGLGEGLRLSD